MSFAPFTLRWRLAPGFSLARSGQTGVSLGYAGGERIELKPASGFQDVLLALAEGADEEHLLAVAGAYGAARLFYYLARLVGIGVLEASADLGNAPAIRLVPRSTGFELPMAAELPRSCTLNRFSYIRRTPRGAMLEHPDASCDLLLESASCSALVTRLAAGTVETALLNHSTERAFAQLLVALGHAVDPVAQEPPAHRTWEFHDRLFQRATRSYEDFVPRGGTYRFVGELPAPPAIRPAYTGTSIALPELPAGRPSKPSSGTLHEVMERRRSRRDMAEQPVDLATVGELLYRVARITSVLSGKPQVRQDVLLRPYPSGGAIHELEYYLAVRACVGLAAGFYHYRGREHALTHIEGAERVTAAMLADCAMAWAQPDRPPQVLVVIASRLPRLAWKYTGIAYKVSLMNAGVAIQSLYLVATDLGLVGSAAGSGNPELFAQATGMSSWEETSIAEFGFGRGT